MEHWEETWMGDALCLPDVFHGKASDKELFYAQTVPSLSTSGPAMLNVIASQFSLNFIFLLFCLFVWLFFISNKWCSRQVIALLSLLLLIILTLPGNFSQGLSKNALVSILSLILRCRGWRTWCVKRELYLKEWANLT